MKEFINGVEANWDLIDEDGMDVVIFIYNSWTKRGEYIALKHKRKNEIIDMCTPIAGRTRYGGIAYSSPLVNLNGKEVVIFIAI